MNILKSSLATFAIAGLAVSASAMELTTNGGFETGDFTGWSLFDNGTTQFVTTDNPSTGSFAGALENSIPATPSIIKQANIGIGIVQAGDLIRVKFDARGDAAAGGVAFAEFFSELDGGGTSKSDILGGGPLELTSDWQSFSFDVTAGPDVSGGVTLQLAAITGADSASVSNAYFDNASVEVVPEPATMTLLGLGALAALRRRKNTKA